MASQRGSELLAAGSGPLAAQAGGLQLAFLLAAAVSLAGSLVATFALQRATEKEDIVATAAAAPVATATAAPEASS